jgi:hypothetical protein
MKNQNLITKISAYIAMLVGSIWLGAYATRMMISYQLFDVDMNLMNYLNEQNLEGILITIIPAINTTFILYIVFIISFTVFLISSRFKLKNNGWLFIISVVIYLTLPFEAYLMTIDYKIFLALNCSDVINSEYVIELIRNRFTSLSSFPIIIFLSYCSLIYFLLFKPFTSE